MTDAATLLLVEDDPVIRTFLADNLTADGYELLVARHSRTRMRELEFKRPDLAVVDLKLPDGSGLELVRRVRAADGVGSRIDPTLPLHMLSGSGGELDRVRGFERGAGRLRRQAVRLQRAAAADRGGAAPLAGARPARAAAGGGAGDRPGGARDAAARAAGRARGEGVRAAAHARLVADARVHQGGAAARRLGLPRAGSTRTLDSHACRLRAEAARDGDQFVVNVWGVGYRLVDGPVESEAA